MNKVSWAAVNSVSGSVGEYKAWIQAMHDHILATGMVQTEDAGQLDIGAISTIPALNGGSGYLMYRFNDSLAGDKPVLIKLRPTMTAGGWSTYLIAAIAASVGHKTDGQGEWVGTNSGEFHNETVTSGGLRVLAGGATPSYAIHTEGRFALALGLGAFAVNSPTRPRCCTLFLDVTRTPDGEGVVITRAGARYVVATPDDSHTISAFSPWIARRATMRASGLQWDDSLAVFCGGLGASSAGGSVQIQRTYRLLPRLQPDPTLTMYWGGTIPDGDEYQVAVDGIERTYKAIGNECGLHSSLATIGKVGFGILWDEL